MTAKNRTLGFDRKISLDWLDATLDLVSQAMHPNEIRARLDNLLEGQVAGTTYNSARGKTKTVLMHIWVDIPENLVGLRDRAIDLARMATPEVRVVLHWGMCLATYPFFYELVLNTGRLLNMQDDVSFQQIERRMIESWGERSTLRRAVQRVVRNLVEWGILREYNHPGRYRPADKIPLDGQKELSVWLIEAVLLGSVSKTGYLSDFMASPVCFPFQYSLSSNEFQEISKFEVVRQGLDAQFVIPK